MKKREFKQGTARSHRGLVVFVFFFLLISSINTPHCTAQWKSVLSTNNQFFVIYFLDQLDFPNIGFAATVDGYVYKTINTGATWINIPMPQGRLYPGANEAEELRDMIFKDSTTGWMTSFLFQGGFGGVLKTTDDGQTWNLLSMPVYGYNSIFYDQSTGGLFLSTFDGHGQLVSWDEGTTWVLRGDIGVGGYSFWNNDTGILSGCTYNQVYPGINWLRTTDGGNSWLSLQIDSECWQPLSIPGTETGFAITDIGGSVLRTVNFWDTWKPLFTFPPVKDNPGFVSSGTIRGDLDSLFVQVLSGCYLSTDTGSSWKLLCGVPTTYQVCDTRFYLNGRKLFLPTFDSANNLATLWYLNLDSLNVFGTSFALPDSVKRTTVTAGNKVTVNFSPQTTDPIGIDSGHILIHFDSSNLSLDSLALPPSWVIVDSSMGSGYLDLHVTADSNAPLPNPIITLTFNTFVGTGLTAKVWLDSAHLFGHRLNCDCQALSFLGPDSVEIDFTGCGDSILLESLRGEPITFSIQSIIPNPARDEIAIRVARMQAQELIAYELIDALGQKVLSGADTPSILNVSELPTGTYYLRLSSGEYVQTRPISIER